MLERIESFGGILAGTAPRHRFAVRAASAAAQPDGSRKRAFALAQICEILQTKGKIVEFALTHRCCYLPKFFRLGLIKQIL